MNITETLTKGIEQEDSALLKTAMRYMRFKLGWNYDCQFQYALGLVPGLTLAKWDELCNLVDELENK